MRVFKLSGEALFLLGLDLGQYWGTFSYFQMSIMPIMISGDLLPSSDRSCIFNWVCLSIYLASAVLCFGFDFNFGSFGLVF